MGLRYAVSLPPNSGFHSYHYPPSVPPLLRHAIVPLSSRTSPLLPGPRLAVFLSPQRTSPSYPPRFPSTFSEWKRRETRLGAAQLRRLGGGKRQKPLSSVLSILLIKPLSSIFPSEPALAQAYPIFKYWAGTLGQGRYFVLRFKFGRTNVKKREGGSSSAREGLEKRSLHFLIPYQFNLHSNGRHTGSGSSKAYGNPL